MARSFDQIRAEALAVKPVRTFDQIRSEALAVPTATAQARLKAAQDAPIPETSGPGLLATAGRTIAGAARAVPLGVMGAVEGAGNAVRGAFRSTPLPEGSMDLWHRGMDALAGPADASRGTRPERAGMNAGQTVGSFATAPVTFPLTIGGAVLSEMKDQLHIGPEHSMTGAVWEAIAGMVPPLGAAAELKQELARPGVTEADKSAIWEDWWATKAPALLGATAGVGAGAGAWAKSRMARAQAKAPPEMPADLAPPKVEAPAGTLEAVNQAVAGLKEPPGPAKPGPPAKPQGPDPAAMLAKIEGSIMGERPEVKTAAPSRMEKARTQLSSEFTPVRSAEATLREGAELPKATHDIARKLELVAGAGAKAKADVLELQKQVVEPLGKDWMEFEKYAALKRIEDRLTVDAEARKVSTWTADEAKAGLEGLRKSIGDERYARVQEVGQKYQALMDASLKLQVESGRMEPALYDTIKGMNQWYAPFEVVKYLTDDSHPGGTGRPIATRAELTKAIQGIESPDFRIGSIIRKSAEQIERSRIYAEKNRAMLAVGDVAALDKKGEFFRPHAAGQRLEPGWMAINYFKGGIETSLAVPESIHKAIQGMNRTEADLSMKALWQAGRTTLRWGATTANAYFNIRNLFFADLPRAALVSYYGIRGPKDIINFPLDYGYSFFTSLRGNFGAPNDLYMEWLRSGAANSTMQRQLTPDAFKEALKLPPKSAMERMGRMAKQTLNAVPDLASAFEETAKITGLRRAYRLEAIDTLPAAQRQAKLDEIATEIRNYSGSPDFARRGAALDLNLIFMFFNARIQGVTSDLARLGGATGGKQAAAAYARLLPVATAATALHMINSSDDERENFAQVPQYERDKYFMIPRHNPDGTRAYFNTDNGDLVADYWRIPKREITQMIGNTAESMVDFASERDPAALKDFAADMLVSILPVNVSGDTIAQRVESGFASMNPAIKAPIEYATGRDMYRHRDTVPMWLDRASPEEQYKPDTPGIYVKLGELTGQPPMKIQQLVESMTGGITKQFNPAMPGRDVPGPDFPMAMFMRSEQVNRDAEWNAVREAQTKQADEAAKRRREALHEIERIESAPADQKGLMFGEISKRDPKLAKRVMEMYKDRARGITPMDDAIESLSPEERAAYIAARMRGMKAADQGRFLMEMGRKGLLTKQTMGFLKTHADVLAPATP